MSGRKGGKTVRSSSNKARNLPAPSDEEGPELKDDKHEENWKGQEDSELIIIGGFTVEPWQKASQYRRQWNALWSDSYGSFEDTIASCRRRGQSGYCVAVPIGHHAPYDKGDTMDGRKGSKKVGISSCREGGDKDEKYDECEKNKEESEWISKTMAPRGRIVNPWHTASQFRRQWNKLWSGPYGSFEDTSEFHRSPIHPLSSQACL
ncbi:hypothetical protein EJB05_10868, partial [Eragrostis curvula]